MDKSPMQLKVEYVQQLVNKGELKEARRILLYGHVPFDFHMLADLDRAISKQKKKQIRIILESVAILLVAVGAVFYDIHLKNLEEFKIMTMVLEQHCWLRYQKDIGILEESQTCEVIETKCEEYAASTASNEYWRTQYKRCRENALSPTAYMECLDAYGFSYIKMDDWCPSS